MTGSHIAGLLDHAAGGGRHAEGWTVTLHVGAGDLGSVMLEDPAQDPVDDRVHSHFSSIALAPA